ncbi:MAG: hypothetical protein ACI3T9_05065 [Romboutsia timonensis]
MCERYFVKLPNEIVWDFEEESIMLYHNEILIIPILYQLVNNMNKKGQTFFSLEDLVTNCGYVPKNSKGKSNDKFRNALILLEEIGYITDSNIPMKEIKGNTFVKCRLNLDLKNNFFIVYDDDYEKIISLDSKSEKRINVIIIYSYISARIRSDANGNGYTFFKIEDAIEHLGITKSAFIDGIKCLKELGILYYDNNGAVDKNKTSVNVYSFTEEGLNFGLAKTRCYYSNLKS